MNRSIIIIIFFLIILRLYEIRKVEICTQKYIIYKVGVGNCGGQGT